MSHSFPSFKSPCCYLNIILLVTTSVTAVFFFALASNDSWLNGNLFNLQLKDENTQTFHHHQTVQVDSSSLVEKKHFDQITSPSHQHFWIEDADDETIEHLLSQRSDKITKEQSNVNRCHQSSVASCGLMMMKAFKFLRFFPTQEIFTHKCALRSAFFACVQKNNNKSNCTVSSRIKQPERFRRRLTAILWSSRDCLLP